MYPKSSNLSLAILPLISGLCIFLMCTISQDLAFITLSTLTLILLLTLFSLPHTQDWFNPLVLVIFNVGVGTFLRSLFMTYSSNNKISQIFTLGKDSFEFVQPSFYVTIGFVVFCTSFYIAFKYQMNTVASWLIGRNIAQDWNARRVEVYIVFFLIISIVGISLFISTMGINMVVQEILSSSEKRYLQVEGADYKFAALGYYRWMIGMSEVSLYLAIITFLNRKNSSARFLFWFIISVMVSFFFPFFSSSRSSIGNIAFTVIIILSIYRKLNMPLIATVGLLGLLLFNYMSDLRMSRWSDLSKGQNDGLFGSIIYNRNLFDISKTAHIINGVPNDVDYKYGSSFITVLVSPVPRTMWPDKPVIFPGKEIAREIYKVGENNNVGIPPGLVAELYMNFGLLGIILGMAIYGSLLGGLYSSMKHGLMVFDGQILLYSILVVSLTTDFIGGSVSQGLISSLQLYLPLVLMNKHLSKNDE